MAIIFLLFDFIFHVLFYISIVYALRAYFILSLFSRDRTFTWKVIVLSSILLQDCFLYGRFGMCLIWLIPIIFLIGVVKQHIHSAFWIIFIYLFVVTIDLFEMLFIRKLVLMQQISLESTGVQILITIGITSLILLSIRGNRFLAFWLKRGKSGLQTGRMPYKGD